MPRVQTRQLRCAYSDRNTGCTLSYEKYALKKKGRDNCVERRNAPYRQSRVWRIALFGDSVSGDKGLRSFIGAGDPFSSYRSEWGCSGAERRRRLTSPSRHSPTGSAPYPARFRRLGVPRDSGEGCSPTVASRGPACRTDPATRIEK